MDSADLTLKGIKMFLDIHKFCFIPLPQEVDARLGGLPCPAMGLEMNIPLDGYELFRSSTNFKLP